MYIQQMLSPLVVEISFIVTNALVVFDDPVTIATDTILMSSRCHYSRHCHYCHYCHYRHYCCCRLQVFFFKLFLFNVTLFYFYFLLFHFNYFLKFFYYNYFFEKMSPIFHYNSNQTIQNIFRLYSLKLYFKFRISQFKIFSNYKNVNYESV